MRTKPDTPMAALLARGGLVCAHRGARSLAPENTLLAALRALECGSDMWELDVRRTADEHLVILHDDTLERTTDAASRPEFAGRAPWPVETFSLDEVRSLDAGSWFGARDPFGTVASGEVGGEALAAMRAERVPLLREALDFTVRHGLAMNLEIKDQGEAPGYVARVLDEIGAAGARGLVLLSSFNHGYLAEAARLDPELPLGVLAGREHAGRDARAIADYVRGLGAVAYHPDASVTAPPLVRGVADLGILVNPYTVNDMGRALDFFEAGATAVITDFPQRLRAALAPGA